MKNCAINMKQKKLNKKFWSKGWGIANAIFLKRIPINAGIKKAIKSLLNWLEGVLYKDLNPLYKSGKYCLENDDY